MKIATTIGEMFPYTETPAKAIEMYEGTGFKYLDYSFYDVMKTQNHPFLTENWKEEIFEAKATAERLGFSFVQAHAPNCDIRGEGAEKGISATIRSIEACGILGIKNMVIHSGFFREIKYPDDKKLYFEANEPFFRALIPAMEKNDVHILFENTTIKHCAENCFFPITGKDLNDFVSYMNHPLFGAAWDVGHANMDAIDHYAEIMEMGSNLKAIHVHDNNGIRDEHTAPFLGTADYDSLMKGLIESGFSGYFTLESDCFFKFNRGREQGRLAHVSTELKRDAISLLYKISKHILSSYNVYEE
ncbi:MAG: sugar phosphate isomerase/epimerase [Clostridia bacterium]|nr:sugar phosphate isomerase/epimerase [Clostridia bacterium]